MSKRASPSRRKQLLLFSLSMPAMVTGCQSSGSFLASDESCTSERSGFSGSSLTEVSSDMNGRYSPIGGSAQQCSGGKESECKRRDDFDRSAIPAPPGTYVNQWNEAMICSARQYHLIVSRHEWSSGGIELGPEGREHVASLATRLSGNSDNVFIETEPVQPSYEESLEDALNRTAALNDDRRATVIQHLVESGLADAEQRVFLMPVERVGMHGFEAPRVYNRLLSGGQGGGQGGGQAGGGIGGGGGGF